MSTLSPHRKRTIVFAALAGLGMIALAGGGLASSLKTATAITPPTTSVDQMLTAPSLAGVVEAVSPAVVSIEVMHKARPSAAAQQWRGPNVPEHFKRFFGEDFAERFGLTPDFGPGPMAPSGGIGSGFIVDADGYIVTSNHVIAGAETVTVILDDGSRLDAALVGHDVRTDLALLKVQTDEPLPALQFAAGDGTRVGDWVVAIGNPFGVGKTATFGIVSARGRGTGPNPNEDHLQIDAPINRGNSGGPTVNLHGEVIGVNTSIVSPTGGNVGIGFAVPAATATMVIDDLKAHGHVMRGWLGVHIQPVTEDIAASLGLEGTEGAIVARVQPESPAEAAGLEQGDVIIAVDQAPIDDTRTLSQTIAATDAGASATLTVWRDGETVELTAAIANATPAVEASAETSGGDEAGRLDTFGLRLENVDSQSGDDADMEGGSGAVVVANVAPGSAAHRKGVRPGDTIVSVDKEPVGSIAEVNERIEAAQGDGRKAVLMLMSRDGSERFVAFPFATS